MKQLLYIIGEPGSGKSTLLAHLTRSQARIVELEHPFHHRTYAPKSATGVAVTELGKRRPDFPGTDALSMSVQPLVKGYLGSDMAPKLAIAEGDRLGNSSFFDAVIELGFELKLIVLEGEEESRLHRSIRSSNQPEDWVAGRRTKVYNLRGRYPHLALAAGSPLAILESRIAADQGNLVYRALTENRR